MVRIGIVSQWYPPESGTARIPSALARSLAARAHRVRVLTGFPNYPTGTLYEGYHLNFRERSSDGGVTVRRAPLYPSHDASRVRRTLTYGTFALAASALAWNYLSEAEALWFYNSPPTVSLPVGAARRRSGARTMMHVMDLWPDSLYASGLAGGRGPDGPFGLLLDKVVSKTYDLVDVVAYVSPGVRDLLCERGVPAEKLAYVPLWADEEIFAPRRRDAELAGVLGVRDRVVLLYAGSLGNIQGLETVLEACGRLGGLPEFHCLVAGTGTAEAALRRRAALLGLTNLTFLGPQPYAQIPALMSVGDVHLVSLRSDPLTRVTLPSKIYSTLASGRPLIGAVEGDAARVIADAGAGWVCPPGDADALEAAIRSAVGLGPAGLAALGSTGRAYYDRTFSLEAGASRVEALLLGRAPGRAR